MVGGPLTLVTANTITGLVDNPINRLGRGPRVNDEWQNLLRRQSNKIMA